MRSVAACKSAPRIVTNICVRSSASATASLAEVGCETPRLDAELLLAHVLGVDRAQLVMAAETEVSGTTAPAIWR